MYNNNSLNQIKHIRVTYVLSRMKKMKKTNAALSEQFQIQITKIVERGKMGTHSTQIHDL